jgi:hypothetical protein
MAIAIPRGQRWQRTPRWLIATLLVGLALVVGVTTYGRLASFAGGSSISSQDAPTARAMLGSNAYAPGEPVTGTVTVAAAAPTTLRDLTVSIFPVGERRGGVDEASVRTRSITLVVNETLGQTGASRAYTFTWDQKTDRGTQAPLGSYVLSIRVAATVDQGNAHAALTIAANEPVVELR